MFGKLNRTQVPSRTCRSLVGIAFTWLRVFVLVVVGTTTGLPAAMPQQEAQDQPLAPLPNISIAQNNDVLEKIGAANVSLLTIAREDGILKSGIPLHYQEANNVRNQIGQAIRGYGGHSSVSGNNQYECHLISQDLTGLIQRNESARLMLQEMQGQKRHLEVNDSAAGLKISIANNEDYFLLFHDRREQGLIVQESDGDFMFNGHYADFNDFCLRNSDYCQTRLFPLLRRFGIKFPETAYESSVRQLMTDLLVGDPQEMRVLLSRVEQQIFSSEYQQRQMGLKQLLADYPANRLSLVRLILDEQQPADLRHHLLAALAEQDKALHQTLKNIVLPQDLLNNVPFLVWVLNTEENSATAGQTEPPAVSATGETEPPAKTAATTEAVAEPAPSVTQVHPVVAIVRQRLAQLTDQPAETPAAQWLELALGPKEQAPILTSLSLPVAFFENSDGFQVIAGKCQAFLQLVSDDVVLRTDREHWRAPFHNQTPRENFDETRQFLQSRSLPSQWLVEPTDYKLDEDVYPLVLFERMRPDIKERAANPNHAYYRTQQGQNPTNACRIDGETLLLSMDMGESPVKLEPAPFRLQFAEQAGKKRTIQLVDRPGKDFSLTLHSEELGVYARLQVKANGETSIRQFQGSQTFQSLAPSFKQFQIDHPTVMEQVVLPTLKLLGADLRQASTATPTELP